MHLGSQGFLDIPSPVFQIQILLLIGRSMMLWVLSTDRVQNLLQALEHSLGIPSALQRLLYGGKQLDASFPLSFYNIERDATLVLSLHLRGGAAEHSSSTPTFSYKDVFHAQPKKAAQSLVALKTFLVDKMEEVLSIDISHPDLADQLQKYAKVAIICRFNGLWPRTKDLRVDLRQLDPQLNDHLLLKGFILSNFRSQQGLSKGLNRNSVVLGNNRAIPHPLVPRFRPLYHSHHQDSSLGQAVQFTCPLMAPFYLPRNRKHLVSLSDNRSPFGVPSTIHIWQNMCWNRHK